MPRVSEPIGDAAAPAPLQTRPVVTAFLEHNGKILLLRRSDRVRTYTGRWAGISGSIEPGRSPEEQARTEILEETGLVDQDVRLLNVGEPFAVVDSALSCRWLVHPFRFAVAEPDKIRIDWEHVELRWIDPADLLAGRFETVPNLADAWLRVA